MAVFFITLVVYLIIIPSYRSGLIFQQVPIPVPKLSTPVWSLATLHTNSKEKTTTTNMNIVTYVSAVSIKPEPIWALSLYKSSLSHELFTRQGWGLLQLLNEDLAHPIVVSVLGKQSGRDIDKLSIINQQNIASLSSIQLSDLPIQHHLSATTSSPPSSCISVFQQSPVILCIEKSQIHPVIDVGDHDLILCKIRSSFCLNSGGSQKPMPILMTQKLRDLGLL
jgi:flavin reductase (DIM6/NTAB) family NADH-FMN oxidoreductase RutF